MCQFQPPCPPADAVDRDAAHVVRSHPDQGRSQLCYGAILFDDTGVLLPGGRSIPPHRACDEADPYQRAPAPRPLVARAAATGRT